jgi:hypothetical protein
MGRNNYKSVDSMIRIALDRSPTYEEIYNIPKAKVGINGEKCNLRFKCACS